MITDALYDAIKKQLKKAKGPVTCNDIFDVIDVRQLDDVTTDDVSNALAALWRRGLLERYHVHKNHGRGPRFSYTLRKDAPIDTQHTPAEKSVNVDKLDISQADDGTVTLKTDRLLITVKPFK